MSAVRIAHVANNRLRQTAAVAAAWLNVNDFALRNRLAQPSQFGEESARVANAVSEDSTMNPDVFRHFVLLTLV